MTLLTGRSRSRPAGHPPCPTPVLDGAHMLHLVDPAQSDHHTWRHEFAACHAPDARLYLRSGPTWASSKPAPRARLHRVVRAWARHQIPTRAVVRQALVNPILP